MEEKSKSENKLWTKLVDLKRFIFKILDTFWFKAFSTVGGIFGGLLAFFVFSLYYGNHHAGQ